MDHLFRLKYFLTIKIVTVILITVPVVAYSETEIYLKKNQCNQPKQPPAFEHTISESFRPNVNHSQGNFSTCYGFTALYLLQYLYNSTHSNYNSTHSNSNSEAPQISVLDVLGQGQCGKLKELGSTDETLYQIKKSLTVAVEPYPFNYQEVFQNLKDHPSNQESSCHRSVNELISPQLLNTARFLDDKTGAFKAMDQHPEIRREKLPPFNLYTDIPTDLTNFKNKIQDLLSSTTPIPLVLDYCPVAIDKKCQGFHSVNVTGIRRACCGETCHDELQIEDSALPTRSGWFLADPLLSSTIQFTQAFSYISPCSAKSSSLLPKCQESVISKTPIHFFVNLNDPAMIKKLAEQGVNINQVSPNGFIPLTQSIFKEHFESMNALLEKKAKINIQDKNFTPLTASVLINKPSLVNYLLDMGADIEFTSPVGLSPLGTASKFKRNEALSTLLSRGANPNQALNGGNTALILAANADNIEGISELLKHHAHLNHRNDGGQTALTTAIQGGRTSAAIALLNAGSEVKVKDAAELVKYLKTLQGRHKEAFGKALKTYTRKMATLESELDSEAIQTLKILTFYTKNL